jgi:hypothetical protein
MLSRSESETPAPERTQGRRARCAREADAALELYQRAVSRELMRREIAKFGAELAALGAELQTLAGPGEPPCPGAPRSNRMH